MTLTHNRRYRLTRDVTNPEVDRRQKYDLNYIPWEKGMTLRAVECRDRYRDGSPSFFTLEKLGGAYAIGPSHTGWAALVEALEPLPENALDVMSEVYGSNVRNTGLATDVVRRLYETGAVTREQLVAAMEAVLAEIE